MSLWRQLQHGWRGLWNNAARRQDVADELSHYFAEAEAEMRDCGLSSEEARKAVRQELGSTVVARDQASEYGWENRVKSFSADVRFAIRQLWKHPVFAMTAVLTLALGIGVNTAIFTVVERVLFAPLNYNNAERLAVLETYRGENGKTVPGVTGPDAMDVREQARSLQSVALYSGGSLGVQLRDHAAYTVVTIADANFARVFALQPVAGRLYTEADAKRAALVSERFAQDNFGSAQAAIGQVIHVEGEPLEIVGVIGGGFDFPKGTQVWMASPAVPESQSRTSYNYKAIALLSASSSFESAQAELNTISDRLRAAYAKENRKKTMMLQPLKEALTGDSRSTLLLLWAAAGVILLIACVNVMHLELVRSMERERELAIRRALGSSRWRVMQPVFIESLLVALVGGAVGVLLAFPSVRILVAMAPKQLPRMGEIHLNVWVLAFALGVSLVTAVLSATLPAMRAANIDPAEALKSDSSRGMGRKKTSLLRDGLVVAEVAMTFVLAVGAALLLRTVITLDSRDAGFEPRQMLVVDADAPAVRETDLEKTVLQFNQLFSQLEHLPGVQHVAGIMGLPMSTYGSNGYYEVKGGPAADGDHPAWSYFSVVSPGYFTTMGIRLKRGRDFTSEDTHGSEMVAVISDGLARQSFGDADPVGKQIRCGLDSDKWMLVIGVVGDVRQDSPAERPGATLYMPMTQHPYYANQIHVVLRTAVKPLALMKAVDAKITGINPLIARRYTTMDEMVNKSTATERFRAALISSFAGVGLLLAMLGVYGTISYSVAQRRFEFGVRMAFGAERAVILRSVLGHATRMASLGIVIGVALSLGLVKLVESMLVGVTPTDPLSLSMVSAVLLATALAAAWGPGQSATRISPMKALRAE